MFKPKVTTLTQVFPYNERLNSLLNQSGISQNKITVFNNLIKNVPMLRPNLEKGITLTNTVLGNLPVGNSLYYKTDEPWNMEVIIPLDLLDGSSKCFYEVIKFPCDADSQGQSLKQMVDSQRLYIKSLGSGIKGKFNLARNISIHYASQSIRYIIFTYTMEPEPATLVEA